LLDFETSPVSVHMLCFKPVSVCPSEQQLTQISVSLWKRNITSRPHKRPLTSSRHK